MIERRSMQTDTLTLLLRIAATVGWVVIFIVQVLVWIAAPELNTGIARYHELELRDQWQGEWIQWLPFLLGACTLLSLFAIGASPFRSRRKNDPKRVHLLILLGLTIVGYAVYWFQILGNTN